MTDAFADLAPAATHRFAARVVIWVVLGGTSWALTGAAWLVAVRVAG